MKGSDEEIKMAYIEVTDEKFRMDAILVRVLDAYIERLKKKWDICLLVDGEEGCGKSNLAIGISKYLQYKLGGEFTEDDVYFDVDKLIKAGAESRGRVIDYDEAALSAMGKEWQNKAQQMLIKLLITSRKYGNIYIFVIPDFSELNKYIVAHRSIGLFHVFSRDGISRGDFAFYSKYRLQELYRLHKRGIKTYKGCKWRGNFPKGYDNLIDVDAYEKKKDEAIENMVKGLDEGKKEVASATKVRLQAIQRKVSAISEAFGIQKKDLAKHFEVKPASITQWAKIGTNFGISSKD